VSVFATGTGIGSWPGTSARQAAEVVVGELGGSLAHLVELPGRGVGADLIGRAGALLVDIAIDTAPRGYRLAARPGAVSRRAVSLLGEDADALEEAWEIAGLRGSGQPVKVQAPGPLTLAAEVELANGHRAITDPGAVRDLAASLAEGLKTHRAELSRRLDTPVVVQFDEPSLTAAVAAVTDRIGFARSVLGERVGISPVCGMAGATPEWARTAVGLVRKAGEALAQDPEAV
jgi:hypothetical protein